MRVLIILMPLCLFALSLPAAAKIQCECPTVEARGKGETSCSAVESNNQCDIDFNLFGKEEERRTLETLSKAGVQKLYFLHLNQSTALAMLKAEDLRGVLTVYLFVAAANSEMALNDRFISEVAEVMGRESSELQRRFSSDAQSSDSSPTIHQSAGTIVRFANGCIEAKGDGIWVMYKAAWSPTGSLPQCAPEPLR